jgi:hypothetical protein
VASTATPDAPCSLRPRPRERPVECIQCSLRPRPGARLLQLDLRTRSIAPTSGDGGATSCLLWCSIPVFHVITSVPAAGPVGDITVACYWQLVPLGGITSSSRALSHISYLLITGGCVTCRLSIARVRVRSKFIKPWPWLCTMYSGQREMGKLWAASCFVLCCQCCVLVAGRCY